MQWKILLAPNPRPDGNGDRLPDIRRAAAQNSEGLVDRSGVPV